MAEGRSTEEPQYEAIIIGAGVCGIYQLHRLVELELQQVGHAHVDARR